jgi:hypothetical protein
VAYLAFIFFAAFWPFDFVAVCLHRQIDRTPDGGVRTGRCAALSSPAPPKSLANAFRKANEISIEADIQSAGEDQSGPARIFSYSAGVNARNFTLGQEGNAAVLRLRTSETDRNGTDPHLEIPDIIPPGKRLHLLVTYDGQVQRLFVDGALADENREVTGDFSPWESDHYLTLGNERTPNRPWRGVVYTAALYTRALSPREAARNFRSSRDAPGGAVRVSDDLVAFYNFSADTGETIPDRSPAGFGGPLVTAAFQGTRQTLMENFSYGIGVQDMILNVIAFLPIAFFLYRLGPVSLHRRPALFVLTAFFIGLSISFSIEYFQQFTERRSPNLLDLIYNSVGGGLGGLLAWLDARRERSWLVAPPAKGESE